MKIGIVGASGFLGSYLLPFLESKGHEVFAFNRHTLTPTPCDAVINLAGESIAEGRWTPLKKEHILKSRIETTRQIVTQLKPRCLLSASGIGYYGNRPGILLDESSSKGDGFLGEVCEAWEHEASLAPGRVAYLRFGVILAKEGGAFNKLKMPFRFGQGNHHLSWIHLYDAARAIEWILKDDTLKGPFNLCTPHPLTQRQFIETIQGWSLPLPLPLIRSLFGDKADGLLLQDTRATPKKLLLSGFTFIYPTLKDALTCL